jgi:hypothetical protein
MKLSHLARIGFLCTGILLNFIPSLSAQSEFKAVCTAGQPYDVVNSDEKYYFIKDDALLIFKFQKEQVFIQKFNKSTLALIATNRIEGLPPKCEFEGLHAIPGKLLFFFSEKKKESFDLFSREVDFSTANLSAEVTQHITADQPKDFAGSHRQINQRPIGDMNNDFFKMVNSSDSSKMLIYYLKYTKRPGEKTEDYIFGLSVYDCTGSMKKLWGKELNTKYDVNTSNFLSYTVDNDGNVFALGYTYPSNEEIKKAGDSFDPKKSELLVLQAGAEEKELIYSKIDFNNMRCNNATIEAFTGGKVWITGSFRYKDAVFQNFEDVHGYFQCRIGSGGVLESKVIEAVPAEVSTLDYTKDEKQSGKPNVPGFGKPAINQALVSQSGERILIGESFYTIDISSTHYDRNLKSNSAASPTLTSAEYLYDEISVAAFKNDGKIAYIKSLPKSQRSGRARASISYKYFESGDHSYFFYMDNLKNLESKPYKAEEVYLDQRPGYMAAYRMNKKTGDFNMVPLFDISKVNGMQLRKVAPYSIVQSGPDEFIMETNNENKDLLVRFTVPLSE